MPKKSKEKGMTKAQMVAELASKNDLSKSQINDILDFKDITRQEILKQENLDKLNEMENEMYKYFDKMKCGYYRKTDNYVINFFRGMLKEMGYKGIRQEKDKHVNIHGENYRKKFVYFHIE